MKKSGYSDSQIISILKQAERVTDLFRSYNHI